MDLLNYRCEERGRNKERLNLRFDFLSEKLVPVWITFGPRKVQFPRHCQANRHENLKKLLNINIFIHHSADDYFKEAESKYRILEIHEFSPTDMLIEWKSSIIKERAEEQFFL